MSLGFLVKRNLHYFIVVFQKCITTEAASSTLFIQKKRMKQNCKQKEHTQKRARDNR